MEEEPLKILSLRLLPSGAVRFYTQARMTKEEQIKLLEEALKYLLST